MGRENRPNIPGAIYHVMNRGNRKQVIFEDDRDRRRFLRILVEQQAVYGVKTLAGTLMTNHFHLGILTPHGNLSEFMQQLEGRFASYSNWRHQRVGHLFQGRFRHVLIEHDTHLLTALCYILMNPVTAGLVNKLEDYKWSTYAATAGFKTVPSYLSIDWLDSLFPGLSRPESQCQFRRIMSASHSIAAYLYDNELNVSVESIGQVIQSYTGKQFHIASLPRTYRTALRPGLDELLVQANGDRNWFITEARVSFGYRNAELARALRLKPATVSWMFRKLRHRRA